MPIGIDKVTNIDIILWDWIIRDDDLENIVCCILLPGYEISRKDLEILKEKRIPLYIQKSIFNEYSDMNLMVKEYEDNEDLLIRLSTIR